MKIIESKKKKHKSSLRVLSIALILMFLIPVTNAFAYDPSTVTYDTYGATDVPSQSAYDSFISDPTFKYYKYEIFDGSLYLVKSATPFVINGSVLTSEGGEIYILRPTDYVEGPSADMSHSSNSGDHIISSDSGTTDPDPTDPDPSEPVILEPIEGGENMFSGLTTTAITTEATNWAGQFDAILLVVVGVGIGFAAVRFVKSMFF